MFTGLSYEVLNEITHSRFYVTRVLKVNTKYNMVYIDGLVQDCSNSCVSAMELLQSCTKPLIWYLFCWWPCEKWVTDFNKHLPPMLLLKLLKLINIKIE